MVYYSLLVYLCCVICDQCQGQKDPQEQRLKKKVKFNFQTRNETRLYDSKIKIYELRIRT